MLATLWQWLRRGLRLKGQERASVELGVVEQLALLYLLRFPGRSVGQIHQEIAQQRPITALSEVVLAVRKLEAAGLLERAREPGPVGEEPLFQSSRRALPLKGRLPPEPKSTVAFYL